MKTSLLGYAAKVQSGFTMVEVIVVLVLLTLAAAVVAPSLLSSHSEVSSELPRLMRSAREAAIRRGETVHLRIDQSGAWQVVAGPTPPGEILLAGQLSSLPGGPTHLVFSPLGTCGPAVESEPLAPLAAINPLTCEEGSP